MMNVFVCRVPNTNDPIREGIAITCLTRWFELGGVCVIPITPDYIGCSAFEFQRSRRIYADAFAATPEYIVADDDCLLPEDFNLSAALKIFRESCFSVLSLMPSNANISPWTPDHYTPEVTDDVMEHYASGGVRFSIKGHLEKWPPMKEGWPGYDTIHGDAIRAAGGRIGYFRKHFAVHLGEGRSSIWNHVKVVA